jgi:hypothetical protein
MAIDLPWGAGTFLQAKDGVGAVTRSGYLHKGLAIAHDGWGEPRSRTLWTLFHIGSGGAFLQMIGDVATVFPVATEIAECGDWTLFDMPDGWKQTDPELGKKVFDILTKNPQAKPTTAFIRDIDPESHRAVIAAREG